MGYPGEEAVSCLVGRGRARLPPGTAEYENSKGHFTMSSSQCKKFLQPGLQNEFQDHRDTKKTPDSKQNKQTKPEFLYRSCNHHGKRPPEGASRSGSESQKGTFSFSIFPLSSPSLHFPETFTAGPCQEGVEEASSLPSNS